MRYRRRITIQAMLAGCMIGALAWTLYLPAGLAIAADISIIQSGLHDWDTTYGLNLTGAVSPYLNADNYSIQVSGDDSGGYDIIHYTVSAITSSEAIDIENQGRIVLNASGGESSEGIWFEANGISTYGMVNNNDNLSVTTTGGVVDSTFWSDLYTWVSGIYANGEVQNNSIMSVTAEGGTATGSNNSAQADIVAEGIGSYGAVYNSGTLSVAVSGDTVSATSGASTSIWASGITSHVKVDNSGSVVVTAISGTVTSSDYEAQIYTTTLGVRSDGSVDNSGTISVFATGNSATSTAGYANVSTKASGIIFNEMMSNIGSISAAATGGSATSNHTWALTETKTEGIVSYGTMNNDGSITVITTGGTAASNDSHAQSYTEALGIKSIDTLSNSGIITVIATGGTATSLDNSAYSYDGIAITLATGIKSDGTVDNSGDIFITATGGTTVSTGSYDDSYSGYLDTTATGIESHGLVNNSGDISVNAIGGYSIGEVSVANCEAIGIFINGDSLERGVINNGNIFAAVSDDEGYEVSATGIYFENGGSLTNTGVIQAYGGTRAYEVAVAGGTVTLVDEYNLTLDGNPAVGSLYVAEGAELHLNGAMLGVTAVGNSTLLNTEYRIFDTDDGSTITGSFGGLNDITGISNPDITALYHDQGTSDSADDTVSLSYQPAASPQLETIGLLRDAVSLPSNLIGLRLTNDFLSTQMAARDPRLYAAANSVAVDTGPQLADAYGDDFFFTPYYATADREDTPAGYDADLAGFVTGLDRSLGKNQYGFHLGYGHAGIDFTGNGYNGDTEEQELFSTGVHLMGSHSNWTWRGQVDGFYAWHDYDGVTGLNLEQHESANYNSYGLHTTLLGGHLFRFAKQMLLPEVGADHLWLHRESFTTEADDANWDLHSSSLDEHQVSALASLRWLTHVQTGQLQVTPSLAIGMRYLLTDDELEANQSVAGSGPVTVRADQDKTTGTVSASVQFGKEQLAMELAYDGELGDDTTMHSAWLRFRYLF